MRKPELASRPSYNPDLQLVCICDLDIIALFPGYHHLCKHSNDGELSAAIVRYMALLIRVGYTVRKEFSTINMCTVRGTHYATRR